jgi:cellulase/cellobiase CelA1
MGSLRSLSQRSVSPQARVLVISGVIAGAVVTSFVLAAAFVSIVAPPPLSEDATRAAANSVSPTPTPTPTASPTPTRTSTPSIKPMVTPTLTETPEAVSRPIVGYYPTSQWDDGFVGIVSITNTSSEPLQWEIRFELHDAEINGVWQAEVDQDDEDVTARGLDYNAVIQPGDHAEFGFRAVGDNDGELRDCTINGEPCDLRSG